MAEAALVAGAFAANYLGLALLALRQKPHHAAVTASRSRAPLPRGLERRCLVLGGAGLGAGFALSLLAEGPSFGSILWILSFAVAGFGVMFTLSFRPHWLRPVQRSCAALERSG